MGFNGPYMAAAKARLPSGFAGSRKVTGSLAGTQCRGNTTFTTGVMLGACLALGQRPVARTTVAYATLGDVRAAFSSHAAQSPAISTLPGARLPLLRDQRAAVLCHHIYQRKYNYCANSSQPLLKSQVTVQ